ncbi:hypothetical protein [Paenibacillus tengchongensis]|uniref:hypothetical protein n=1 Tax=Paenibacillus tengchongensis TaxID=2608684 RepID=UPI00124DD567|nr:hypothetical protein [Paenibacillus tengchongensis]
MLKKHCLFCDDIVPMEQAGGYDRYMGCSCAPGGSYRLLSDSYEEVNALPYPQKREMFHIISAYIRERTDCGDKVALSAGDLPDIVKNQNIPVTIEDKGNRLLQYLYRHSEGPLEPVVIQPLSASYNLTYSANLQELVYIIDKLQGEQLLIREGMTFKLTEAGWREAAAGSGGKRLKPCSVLLPEANQYGAAWSDELLPRLEQCGYRPELIGSRESAHAGTSTLPLIADSELMIADLTGQASWAYFMGGYALGSGIPVLWTVHSSAADDLPVQPHDIRPLVWDTAEELAAILQQRITMQVT